MFYLIRRLLLLTKWDTVLGLVHKGVWLHFRWWFRLFHNNITSIIWLRSRLLLTWWIPSKSLAIRGKLLLFSRGRSLLFPWTTSLYKTGIILDWIILEWIILDWKTLGWIALDWITLDWINSKWCHIFHRILSILMSMLIYTCHNINDVWLQTIASLLSGPFHWQRYRGWTTDRASYLTWHLISMVHRYWTLTCTRINSWWGSSIHCVVEIVL